jgi:hypothetical protein
MGIGARLLIPLRRATLPRRKDKDGAARCEKDHENTESTKRMMKLAGQPLFNVFRFVLSSFRVFVIFQDVLGKTVAIM